MPTLTPQQIIKTAASTLHRDLLKARGFTKSGNNWVRRQEWTRVINLQLSSYNSAEEASFTINLGILIPALRAACGEPPIEGNPKEYDCDLRQRIGWLRPHRQDKWWSVSPSADPAHLATELADTLLHYGLPWFDSFPDMLAVARYTDAGFPRFRSAIAYQLAGDTASASQVMAEAISNAPSTVLPKLRRITGANGIPLPI
jgi:hypothetical protein